MTTTTHPRDRVPNTASLIESHEARAKTPNLNLPMEFRVDLFGTSSGTVHAVGYVQTGDGLQWSYAKASGFGYSKRTAAMLDVMHELLPVESLDSDIQGCEPRVICQRIAETLWVEYTTHHMSPLNR